MKFKGEDQSPEYYFNELFQTMNGAIDVDPVKKRIKDLPIENKLSISMGMARWYPVPNCPTWEG